MQLSAINQQPPLTRAECSALVERLQRESEPVQNDLLRIARYAFVDRPEGIVDWARAEVFDYLKGATAGIPEASREEILSFIMRCAVDDMTAAKRKLDLTPPPILSDAVQLVFFGGGSDALRTLFSAVKYGRALPEAYYRAVTNDLAAVLREISSVPRTPNFLSALTEIGRAAYLIAHDDLKDVEKPEDDDDLIPTRGRAAQFGAPQSTYGMKVELGAMMQWVRSSCRSDFQRKLLHERLAQIAESCGISVKPEPPPQFEWYQNLRFPFFHRREVKRSAPESPPSQQP